MLDVFASMWAHQFRHGSLLYDCILEAWCGLWYWGRTCRASVNYVYGTQQLNPRAIWACFLSHSSISIQLPVPDIFIEPDIIFVLQVTALELLQTEHLHTFALHLSQWAVLFKLADPIHSSFIFTMIKENVCAQLESWQICWCHGSFSFPEMMQSTSAFIHLFQSESFIRLRFK